MWPLDRAKIDSVCASRSRCSSRSVTLHGSTANTLAPITCPILRSPSRSSLLEQLAEILDDDIGAVLAQRLSMASTVDPDDPAEVTGTPRLDAGLGVLEHRRVRRL